MVTAVLNLISSWIFGFVTFMVKALYNLIVLLADVNIMGGDTFDKVRSNIFGLIGLFMIFKLAFSIIQYITDPDKLTDKSTGASKILVKIVVVLILLGTVNTVFEKAFEFQGLILKNSVLERLVFGDDSSNENVGDTIDKVILKDVKTSDYLAYSILAPFVRYNTEADIWGDVSQAELDECDEFIKATDTSLLDANSICTSKCAEVVQTEDPTAYKVMCNGLANRDISKALSEVAMLQVDQKAIFVVDGLFGLVVGAICIVVLIVIAVGVAIRSVKLAFLQVIAPLPIISYIDPKDNSNSMFNKWTKETIKTFLELFIRLLAFYFAILVITRVLIQTGSQVSGATGSGLVGFSGTVYTLREYPLVIIFLIIGCFLFALQLPKLIENLFGSLGGFSRDAKSTAAIAAGIGGVAGGIIGGGIANAVGTGKMLKDENGGKMNLGILGRSALAGVTGAVGTGGRSIVGAVKGTKVSGEGISAGSPFKIASSAISRTGEIRNARAIQYTDSKGRQRSAYSAFPSPQRAYGRFAAMAGIKDNYSAVGRRNADIKTLEAHLRQQQNNLSKASSDRVTVMQSYNNAVHERQMLENTSTNFDENMFVAIGGSFDATANDFVFDVDGVSKNLQDMSASDYTKVFHKARSDYQQTDVYRNSTPENQRILMSEFDKKWSISNTTEFVIKQNQVKSDITNEMNHRTKLENAKLEERRLSTEYTKADQEYNRIQSDIVQTNKDISAYKSDIEKINKANKKK